MEQRGAHPLLKPGHGLGHRGLGKAQLLGGLTEGAFSATFAKIAQASKSGICGMIGLPDANRMPSRPGGIPAVIIAGGSGAFKHCAPCKLAPEK